MSNQFDDIRSALSEAKDTLRAADQAAGSMAAILVDRLRHVGNEHTLRALKAELRDFNAVTGKWKPRKLK